jgi:hypothetical protein
LMMLVRSQKSDGRSLPRWCSSLSLHRPSRRCRRSRRAFRCPGRWR